MRRFLLALGLVALGAAVVVAQGSSTSRTTNPPQVVRVKVTITDDAINMSPKVVPRGATARFILVNNGKKPHTFTFGQTKHGSRTQTGFVRTLKPRGQSVLLLFLDSRGTIAWAGTLPADRAKPRMQGTFRVT